MQAVVTALGSDGTLIHAGNGTMDGARGSLSSAGSANGAVSAEGFGRERPFLAQVLENFSLNGRGSDKETRYLKLSLEGSGLSFEPGDSLGIYPQNRPGSGGRIDRPHAMESGGDGAGGQGGNAAA